MREVSSCNLQLKRIAVCNENKTVSGHDHHAARPDRGRYLYEELC